jgi:hypothetical protein
VLDAKLRETEMAKEPQAAGRPGETVTEVTMVYSETGAVRTLQPGQQIPPGFSRQPPEDKSAEDLSGIPPQHRHSQR